jgi:hypothetical protein
VQAQLVAPVVSALVVVPALVVVVPEADWRPVWKVASRDCWKRTRGRFDLVAMFVSPSPDFLAQAMSSPEPLFEEMAWRLEPARAPVVVVELHWRLLQPVRLHMAVALVPCLTCSCRVASWELLGDRSVSVSRRSLSAKQPRDLAAALSVPHYPSRLGLVDSGHSFAPAPHEAWELSAVWILVLQAVPAAAPVLAQVAVLVVAVVAALLAEVSGRAPASVLALVAVLRSRRWRLALLPLLHPMDCSSAAVPSQSPRLIVAVSPERLSCEGWTPAGAAILKVARELWLAPRAVSLPLQSLAAILALD